MIHFQQFRKCFASKCRIGIPFARELFQHVVTELKNKSPINFFQRYGTQLGIFNKQLKVCFPARGGIMCP